MSSAFYVLFAWILAFAVSVQAACEVCQSNGVACLNQTSYQMCFGSNKPNTDQTFTCPGGLVCTDLAPICFQRSERPASCGDTDHCGRCNSSLVFACTSLNTFALCFGATMPTNVTGVCPDGRFCDATSSNICVEQTTEDSIVCHLN